MELSLINQYIHNISRIYDKKKEETSSLQNICVNKLVNKYSSTKVPIYKLVIDGKEISRNNNLVITYKCLNCNINNQITLNLFMRKINKNILCCNLCKNLMEEKRNKQSREMVNNKFASQNYVKEKKVKQEIKLENIHMESLKKWEEMDEDFQNTYLLKHLSEEEFERIRYKIISVNNDKIKDLSKYKYVFNFKSNNQTIFNPQLVNFEENLLEKPVNIKFQCENCDNHFISRDLYSQKNKYKILCKDCSFCNKTFKIRNMKNILNEKVIYQSQFEKKFITYCNENNIVIRNGDTIEYEWKDKKLKYKIDFKIPDKKLLIELKDKHIWYTREKLNGKQDSKIEAAKKYAVDIDYRYEFVFQNDYMHFIKNRL